MKDMICSRCNSGDNVKMELGDEPGKIRKNSRNPFRLYAVNTVLYKLIFLNLIRITSYNVCYTKLLRDSAARSS